MNKKKSIFQLLTEKPWETDQIEADNDHQGRTVNITKQKLDITSFNKGQINANVNLNEKRL